MRLPNVAPIPSLRRLPALLLIVLVALSVSLSGGSPANAAGAPSVTGVEVTSDAGNDDTYALGETITITVTFSEAVVVTGTPRLRIDMDPAVWGEKIVDYAGGSGATSLTFDHTVVEPNYSTLGVAVLANSLALNGGSIRSVSSQADAGLSHDGLSHDAGHRVNWQLERPAPTPTPTPEPTPEPTSEPVPGRPAGLRVAVETGSLEVSLVWDDVAGAASYRVRWRPVKEGAKLNEGVMLETSEAAITVADYGQWVARVEACNDAGCGKPRAKRFTVEPNRAACQLAPPERVSALGVARAAVAFWQAPSAESACEPIGYLVGARSVDSGEWTSEIAEPEARSHVLDGLTPGLIEYHVTTIYPRGESQPPRALPQLNVPEACNITLTVEANVDRGISGTWANVTGMPNGCVYGPEIEYEFKESTWNYFRNYGRFNNHGQSHPTQDSFIAYDLKPGVTYDFRIVAVDAAGRKNPSNVARAKVVYDVDGADEHSPRDVRVGVHNRGNAYVEWSRPASNPPGRTLSAFIVEWKTASGAAMTAEVDPGASTVHHITGLTHGSVYSVRVAARTTAAGDVQEAWSSPSPPFTAVSEPVQIWFTTGTPFINPFASRAFFRVDRNTPEGDLDCLLQYGGTFKQINCPAESVVHTDVTDDMSVAAVDTREDGSATRSLSHEGEFGGPRPVFTSGASGGNGTLVVAWSGHGDNPHLGRGSLDAWIVQHRKQNADGETWPAWPSGHVITDTTDRSHTFTGLGNGTWQARVRGRNANTEDHDNDPNTPDQTVHYLGFTSEIWTVTLAAGHTAVPGRVTGGTVRPGRAPVDEFDDEPGLGSLVVEWEPPSGGGSAVYAYQVRHRRGDYDYSTGGGAWTNGPEIYPRQTWRICRKSSVDGCENPRSYAITGLIAGREYDVAVRAKNANGWGDWRWIGDFNIPNGFPPLLQDATVNAGSLTLTFDQTVDTDSKPAVDAFTVTVNGTGQTPTGVAISGRTVTLTLSTAVTSGQTVTVSYTRPEENPLQHNDAQGPSFINESVTNDTP